VDIINNAMLFLLEKLAALTGSFGLAIVAVTALIRVVLWPLNSAQTRSMKKMQEIQPKLKQLQERYKSDPQRMQQELMKFYAENKFNPFSGCLPMLVQIPIFIGLYGALSSPQFMAQAGNQNFLFIDKLYHTLYTHAGAPMDNSFSVKADDHFVAGHKATVTLDTGRKIERDIQDPGKALTILPRPLIPGEPISIRMNMARLGLSEDYNSRIRAVDVQIINDKSKELENLSLTPQGNILRASIPTVEAKGGLNTDVLILLLIYAALTLGYQQLMQKNAPANSDPTQARAMKLMPLMFTVMLFFIPLPAGVLLYLVVTMLLMYVQTWLVMRQEGGKDADKSAKRKPSDQIIDIKPDRA
jgi:YidC/Oxa1 family membrane protein insertase